MRPPICWADLPGRKVGIYGLGTEGQASLRACQARGIEPVLVADSGEGVLLTSEGGLEALLACDVVIKSPGISRYSDAVIALEAAGISVVGGLGLWLQEADRSRVLTIIGTKGKSTTTAITGHLLTQWGYRVLIGGNIGLPPFDPAVNQETGSDYDYWIIEVSSYQATDLSCSTPVVAVTSLSPDHLPWHRNDPDTYYRDKLSGTSQPGADVTIANGDSLLIRERASLLGPRVQWISLDQADDSDSSSIFDGDESSDWMTPLGLLGSHNRRNALIARACLIAMGVPEASDAASLRRAAEGFAGLDSRLKLVGTVNGVDFVDDNLSTNVLPTVAAVEAFPDRRVALIVGGQSRGIDYGSLGLGLQSRREPLLMLTVPDNGPAIREQVEAVGAGPAVTIVDTPGLVEAVRQGYEWAGPGGVVLLSPAAPSFGIFKDYKERGAVFVQAMNSL